MKKKTHYLWLAMTLLALVSCGSDDDDDDNDTAEERRERQEEEVGADFSTRLNDRLLISGLKCAGNETTTYADGTTYRCEADEWLITIDNVNTCDANGACTEVGVIPIVADLDFVEITRAPEYAFFEIDPESPVSQSQQDILNSVYVRTDLNGPAEVVER